MRALQVFRRLVAVLLVAGLATVSAAAANEREPLIIHTGNGPHTFAVEVADTPQERARGLMERDTMAPRHGMLFDFKKPQRVQMWMHKTWIPLDMLFVDHNGVIVHVEHRARPGSLDPRGPATPVLGVVELLGGTARDLGIRRGDRVDHPVFTGGLGGRR